eukprot:1147779-Pelagomonas_calceolata.AAC.2
MSLFPASSTGATLTQGCQLTEKGPDHLMKLGPAGKSMAKLTDARQVCKYPEKGKDGVPDCMSSNKDRSHISLASKNLSSTARQRTD